ncbi:NAD(P)/FAD-dependent oxidoreductase [Pedobacter agri]|uniref:NAD(P)/FAD-dependent oxidoreductase n=3 Tax=Pedobacter agri TaxID=454586 RepID=A0A9X3DB24_9SPHI|nr:NAD(P)/FAD-dependent oxidoreductase [Pedobacter agri]MCX3263896.1 NAD(P)/FAD-dependent oxidoreductase [Pedobacter agri]
MPIQTEILIIGGGLAGLTAALHLNKQGFDVTLIEKSAYPHHKVCGEYISNEVLPYFNWLGIDLKNLSPTQITNLQFTSATGKQVNTTLPLGGFGLSRYSIDYYLYNLAKSRGVNVVNKEVNDVVYAEDQFLVETTSGERFKAEYVLGAYGKRSAIDKRLERNFINQKSPYLAIKAHYKSDFPSHLVSLNNFKGGYCGVSKVENAILNVCYLANYESFKKHKDIQAYQENVLYQNKNLKKILEEAEMIFDAPLTISQISFNQKEPVYDHMLMIGDTAGLIHPLCGNGMAMAIHSAKIVSELIQKRTENKTSRSSLENEYSANWQTIFGSRLRFGRILSMILQHKTCERLAINSMTAMPFVLNKIIKHTHGRPIKTVN